MLSNTTMPTASATGATACPVPKGTAVQEPPDAESLTYTFTLSASPIGPRIARQTAKAVLRAHGLGAMQDAVVQVVGEMAACAWRFTATPEISVCLRYRDGALRVIVYDGHPQHTHARLAASCEAQRTAALRVLASVVKACNGDWGFGDAREPGGGTRMWAVLPHAATATFGRAERPYRKAAQLRVR
jgi:hypothetical protein